MKTKDHDGWKSRTLWVAAVVFLCPFIIASAALFFGKMNADQWVTIIETLVTSVLGLYGLVNVGQRGVGVLAKRAVPAKEVTND